MNIIDMTTVSKAWTTIQDTLSLTAIHDDTQYSAAIETLNALLDQVGVDATYPLYSLLDILGTLIHAYETEHLPLPDVPCAEMLRFLMEQHGLRQVDLPEVGSQGVVSEILAGKRPLNLPQQAVPQVPEKQTFAAASSIALSTDFSLRPETCQAV